MSSSLKKALRLVGIALAAAVVSLAFHTDSSGSGPYASTLDDPADVTPMMGPPPSCEKTACNTACWIDGCKKNRGTFCRRTVIQPIDCPPETGGCVTTAC